MVVSFLYLSEELPQRQTPILQNLKYIIYLKKRRHVHLLGGGLVWGRKGLGPERLEIKKIFDSELSRYWSGI